MGWIRHSHEKLIFLKKNWESVLIIHLSCQTLGDQNEGYSPRITSIAVMHAGSSTMHSFSIHLAAEELKTPINKIESHYDIIESQMLKDFYCFVRSHQEHYWVHWNMRDINFGFEAIAHRHKVLTGENAPHIPDEKRLCLPTLITSIFGHDYVPHPRMNNLMELNGGAHRNVLSGKDEVTAFNNKQFFKMHQSTMAKVYFFRNVIEKMMRGLLKTRKSLIRYQVNEFMERPAVKIIGFIAVLFTVLQLATAAYEWASKSNTSANRGAPKTSISGRPLP